MSYKERKQAKKGVMRNLQQFLPNLHMYLSNLKNEGTVSLNVNIIDKKNVHLKGRKCMVNIAWIKSQDMVRHGVERTTSLVKSLIIVER